MLNSLLLSDLLRSTLPTRPPGNDDNEALDEVRAAENELRESAVALEKATAPDVQRKALRRRYMATQALILALQKLGDDRNESP